MRKRFLSVMLATAMTVMCFTGCSAGSGGSASSGKTIKIGIIDDKTGNNAAMGKPKIAAYQLAADEINKAGGILGKKVELEISDGQSDNTVYQQIANKMCQEGDISCVMGGLTSASREAIRPVFDKYKMLYFYNEQYEGGVADHYTFCTGAVPEQQIEPAFGDLVKQYGKKIYIIAADYNFGHISTQWMEASAKKYGCEIVGKEFIPMDVTNFSSTISNIESAKPDILVSFLVGSNHESFYEQWNSAGDSGLPIFSTTAICLSYEHKTFAPPTMENTYVLAPYLEELDTDAAKAFTKRFRAKFSTKDYPYIHMEVETAYDAMYLYKAAVEKAGTTDTEKVISAFESGDISFDGPSGKVTMDPASHHTIRNFTLFKVNKDHSLSIEKTYNAVKPTFLTEDCGVDLRKSNPNKQFTPQ